MRYRMTARNQANKLVASMDFPPTKDGLVQMKEQMKGFAAQAKEPVVVRGYHAACKCRDIGWYAINEPISTIRFSSRRWLKRISNFDGLLILTRLNSWRMTEDRYIDQRVEEQEQWRDNTADVLSRRGQ